MDSHAEKLITFEEVMKQIYGPYTRDPIPWQPLEDPGTGGHRGRYLWTDAFGVINFITLSREKRGQNFRRLYLGLAEKLVETVHSILGRTRDGRSRLPGATRDEPLRGGLRAGMPDNLDRDIDGQYHHCLTLWMFALNRLSLATGEPRNNHLNDVTGYFIYKLLQDTMKKFETWGIPNNSTSLDTEIHQYYRTMATNSMSFPENPANLGMRTKCYLNDSSQPLQKGLEAVLDVWEDTGPTYLVMFAAALIPGAFREGFLDDPK
ncbi:hypothetical protein F4805DRAFT_465439 [Annulohypoxylon moriforme]|nr:hypothetical protein F4805DRAFT_465439 [Annulohypoxylon moriforme]